MANKLFSANKEIPEVSAINWKLTVINAKIINAAAFPVNIIKLALTHLVIIRLINYYYIFGCKSGDLIGNLF